MSYLAPLPLDSIEVLAVPPIVVELTAPLPVVVDLVEPSLIVVDVFVGNDIGSGGTLNQEAAEDLIGASIIPGAGISVSYNDSTGKTTVASRATVSTSPPSGGINGDVWYQVPP